MDKLVETWLDDNPEWFEKYAIRNLEITTIQKWLKLNKSKTVCETCLGNYSETHKKWTEETINKSALLNASGKNATKCTNNINEAGLESIRTTSKKKVNRSQSTSRLPSKNDPNVMQYQYIDDKNRTLSHAVPNDFQLPSFEIETVNSETPTTPTDINNKALNYSDGINSNNNNTLNSRYQQHNSETNNLISLNMVNFEYSLE